MKKMNNKGYMLVEIILAFSICFALMYFLMDIVIKVKNKNDDLLVEATVKTDQAIITNRLMEYIINEQNGFNCNEITSSGNLIKYNENTLTVVDTSASIKTSGTGYYCNNQNETVTITIPIKVKQMSGKDFNVNINYNYGSTLSGLPTEPEPPIGGGSGETPEESEPSGGEETGGDIPEVPTPIIPEDTTNPTCTMTVSGTTITVNTSDNVGIDASSIDSSWSPTVGNTYTKTFNSATTYTFSMKDTSGNTGSCSIQIINKPMWGCITTMGNNPIENNTNFCYKK